MMLNEQIEIGGGGVSGGGDVSVVEQLLTLHRTLKRIAKARAHLDLQEAEALREAQKLQLWRQFGHTSLPDYMVQELGYTSWRVAEDRLRLANALPQLPKLTEALQNGDLNMSQARELARVATPETEQKWIEKALDLNVRQVEQAVAGHCKGDLPEDPIDPRLVRKTMYLSVRPETEVMFREARKVLDRQRGEMLDDDAVIEALCRAMLRGSQRTSDRPDQSSHVGAVGADRPDQSSHVGGEQPDRSAGAGAPYRVAVTICKECRRGWQHGAGAVVEMSPASVVRAQCDAQWIGDLESDVVERARQEIPPATRRKVLHRDQNRCRVPSCRCYDNLDVHHLVHREHGGTNEMSNLLTICEAHHLAHHDGTLQITRVGEEVTFKFEGRNNFTRRTRELATKKALETRGFGRDQVKAIMMRTVHIAAKADLTEDQWLTIALRYATESAS